MAALKYDILQLDCNIRFSLWQVKMRSILAQLNLHDVLLGFEKIRANWTIEDWKALSLIHLYLSKNILQNVLKEKITVAFVVEIEAVIYDQESYQ